LLLKHFSHLKSNWFFIFVVTCMVVFQSFDLIDVFQYKNKFNNEYYRLFSGHFIHLNWTHASLNILGFCIVVLLWGVQFSQLKWLVYTFSLSLAISFGLYVLYPNIDYYLGLSGVLHGLVLIALIKNLSNSRVVYPVLIFLLVLKVLFEMMGFELNTSTEIGARVVVEAHFLGLISAMLLVVFELYLLKKAAD